MEKTAADGSTRLSDGIARKEPIVACTVGMLMGDAWMMMPWLAAVSRRKPVDLVCGTYALPVWEWGLNHVDGADYDIIGIVDDPDDVESPYCPGKGYHAMTAAYEAVREWQYDRKVLPLTRLGSYYGRRPRIHLREDLVREEDHVVIHPYTRHDWKNVQDVIGSLRFRRPVKVVGLPGEYESNNGEEYVEGFENQVAATLSSFCVIGVLSSFSNLASLFRKQQLVLSFTDGWHLAVNPDQHVMVKPDRDQVQQRIEELGL